MEDETLQTLGVYDPTMEFETEHYDVSLEDATVSVIEELDHESESVSEETEPSEQAGVDSLSLVDDFGITIDSISQAPYLRANNYVSFDSNSNVYELTILGNNYKVLFPKGAALEVIDNQLCNIGSSNITGTVLVNDHIPVNTYIEKTYTLLPLTSASSNSNRYQYSAVGYLTTYSVNGYGSITSNQQYGNNTVVNSPNYGTDLSIDTLIISGLLLALCLIQIIGGIFRR